MLIKSNQAEKPNRSSSVVTGFHFPLSQRETGVSLSRSRHSSVCFLVSALSASCSTAQRKCLPSKSQKSELMALSPFKARCGHNRNPQNYQHKKGHPPCESSALPN